MIIDHRYKHRYSTMKNTPTIWARLLESGLNLTRGSENAKLSTKISLPGKTTAFSKVSLKYTPRKLDYVNQKRQPKSIFKKVTPIAS